ncbi:uncharacterized protein tex12 [Stigmatopora argus]
MSQEGLRQSTGPTNTIAQEMAMYGDSTQSTRTKKKRKSKMSVVSFETTATGAGRDLSVLFSKFGDMLTEMAAVDTAERKELENHLQEAQSLQASLKENKNMLKQTLVQISETL